MADAPAPTQKGLQKRARVQSPATRKERKEGTKETSSSSSAASPVGAVSPSAPKKFQARMMICWLLFGCRLVCQANRILLGALLPAIRQDLTLSDAEAGSLLSAFASGYMFTQILGGAFADLLGGKWILQLAITAVSLGSLVAPVALQQGLWPAYCTYFFMGIFEGPSFPTAGSMLSKWIPARERSTASSLADTRGSIGGLLALAAGPVVASHLGWKACFVIFGMLSMTFCSVWLFLASSSPAQSSWVSKQELKMLIDEGVVEKAKKQRPSPEAAPGTLPAVPWRLFISPPVLAVCYAHSVFNFGRYFLYGWIPTFYSQVLDVPATRAAACMTCLQVADAFVKLIVAPFADNLVNSGRLSILGLRRLLSCSAFVGFGAGLCFCSCTRSPVLVTAALVVAKSAASCHAAGFKTNYLDISKKHTGTISGVGNTMATFASTLSPMLAGTVIQGSGWNAMFLLCFAVNLSGAVVFGLFSSATNLDRLDRKGVELELDLEL